MQNDAALAARQLAFFVQHTCCSDKRLKSDLQLRLRKNHPDVFHAMIALQNAPINNDPIENLKRQKLANQFTTAFVAMEAARAAEKSAKPASAEATAT